MDTGFKLSNHAIERLASRHIDLDQVMFVILAPDRVIVLDSRLLIYQKSIVEEEKHYLYRVFVNVEADPKLIVTAYKTTKLEKYENQI